MENQKYLFYCGKPDGPLIDITLEKDYTFEIWTPTINKITPPGLFFKSLPVWWIFYHLRIFRTPEYKIFLIYYKQKKVAHYSVILPRHFKTPFITENDLQIGPIGTDKDHQRKGLASYTIGKILEFYRERNLKFWYIVREENEISRRLIEKIGFLNCGEGFKEKRPGFGLFDYFVLSKPQK